MKDILKILLLSVLLLTTKAQAQSEVSSDFSGYYEKQFEDAKWLFLKKLISYSLVSPNF